MGEGKEQGEQREKLRWKGGGGGGGWGGGGLGGRDMKQWPILITWSVVANLHSAHSQVHWLHPPHHNPYIQFLSNNIKIQSVRAFPDNVGIGRVEFQLLLLLFYCLPPSLP